MSISEWRRWLLEQLLGGGVHNALMYEELRQEAGSHYDSNLESAITSLVDEGIITSLESNRTKKYVVNFDKLDDAREILHSHLIDIAKNNVIQPYMPEPENYVYWFDNLESRRFKNQSTYRIYFKKTDRLNFAAQLMTATTIRKPRTIYMGSLNESESYISRLWHAANIIATESKDGTFILQDIQDKDRVACGNNRQRGKIALAIFRKLGYIQPVETKGNSTRFKLSGRKPFAITLDEIFNYNPMYSGSPSPPPSTSHIVDKQFWE
jgi:hypothetical protein